MKRYEDFCAEIYRRRDDLIRKKKERRRVALSCATFALCLAILGVIGFMDRDDAIRVLPDESNMQEHIEKIYPDTAKITSLTVAMPDGTVSVTDSDALSRAAELVNENEDSFIFYSNFLWYTDSYDTSEGESADIDYGVSEETHTEEDTYVSGVVAEVVTCPPSPSYSYSEKVTGALAEGVPSASLSSNTLYSATLDAILMDPDSALIFTFNNSDGESVTIALDSEKYPSLADAFIDILEGLEKQ